MLHCFHRNVSAPAWFDSKMAISNSAVHEFDAARWVLDAELTAIQAFRPTVASTNSSGQPVFLVLQTSQGELVNVEIVNNAGYGYDVRAELVCEKGTISLRSPIRTEISSDLTQGIDYPADWRPRFADAYRLQAQAWINAILSGTSVGAGSWDGYRAAAVAEAGLQSLEDGRKAVVPLLDRPTLYDEHR
jgi:myo-inositol 2-dehydrogenase/D-chiro-inositol 1-dehydrogenase